MLFYLIEKLALDWVKALPFPDVGMLLKNLYVQVKSHYKEKRAKQNSQKGYWFHLIV